MARLRLFTAACLPEPLEAALDGIVSDAENRYPGLSWVPKGGHHLTVRFFGGQDENLLPRIKERLEWAASSLGPFEVEVGGLGAFPSDNHPRVLFVPVHRGREALRGLAEAVSKAVQDIGIPVEEREYHGHVTLGRVKEGADGGPARDFLRKTLPPFLGIVPVDRLVLFQSRPTSQGPLYVRLGEFPLAKGR